tara:strand:- start:11264 stop:11884 length:621 start_codon:yes stop_codon:yes gene_type:complete
MDWKLIAKAVGVVLVLAILLSIEARADVTSSGATTNTQTNNAGSNTAITGGYESSTTYQSGSSSNTTTNNETNNSTNTKTAVNPASAPAMSVYGQDSCVIPLAAGVTIIGFSGSFGSYHLDEMCERRKKAKVLNALGMKVAAISLMCQDENIWQAMMDAGTPCPIDGLIGNEAKAKWMEKRKKELSNDKRSMTWNEKPVPSGNINK